MCLSAPPTAKPALMPVVHSGRQQLEPACRFSRLRHTKSGGFDSPATSKLSDVTVQDVPLSRRFALVPLGPPSLSYSSTCKALITHAGDEVQLQVDRAYKKGALLHWCVWHQS